MALTYVAHADFSTPGTASAPYYWKTVTIPDCQVGDLLVVAGANANYDATTARSVATTSGSTSAWSESASTPTVASDCGTHAGWATVTGAGSITVRLSIDAPGESDPMAVCAWRIPAAEWTGTPAYTTVGGADADGQISVVVAATSTVLYLGADWTAADPGSTNTPAGATNHTSYTGGSTYAVATRSWTAQSAGTRNYGPSGLSGKDYGIIVCTVAEAAGGNGDVTAVPGAATAAATGPNVGAALTIIGQTHLTG